MINAKLLQLVVDASNDGIVVAEKEGEDDNILIYVNKAFERMTGFASEDILYQDCRFLQGPERDQPAREAIRLALLSGVPCRQVLRNYRQDGSTFWNELSITPVRNDADQRLYFIGVQKDVTEQVRAQERIQTLEAELAQARAELAAYKADQRAQQNV